MIGCKSSGRKPLAVQKICQPNENIVCQCCARYVAPGDTSQFICRLQIVQTVNLDFTGIYQAEHLLVVKIRHTWALGSCHFSEPDQMESPEKVQIYDFDVTVDDGDPNLFPVDQAFSVTVKAIRNHIRKFGLAESS